MRKTGIRDYLSEILRERLGSAALHDVAREWIETDSNFTRWIHDYAKKQLSDDELLELGDSEGGHINQVTDQWTRFSSDRTADQETALVAALRAMIRFRTQMMESRRGI